VLRRLASEGSAAANGAKGCDVRRALSLSLSSSSASEPLSVKFPSILCCFRWAKKVLLETILPWGQKRLHRQNLRRCSPVCTRGIFFLWRLQRFGDFVTYGRLRVVSIVRCCRSAVHAEVVSSRLGSGLAAFSHQKSPTPQRL
jgi:hypothetical protein